MIFIHRLGIALYWVGCFFAVLCAIAGALFVVSGLVSGGSILGAWVFGVFCVVCWIWGSLMRYILADM